MKTILAVLMLSLILVSSTQAQDYTARNARIAESNRIMANNQAALLQTLKPGYSNNPRQERLNRQTRGTIDYHIQGLNGIRPTKHYRRDKRRHYRRNR